VSPSRWYSRRRLSYIPLQFWFCRNPGLAIPLIALQYHEVRINVEFEQWINCCYYEADRVRLLRRPPSKSLTAASLYIDYIYLDTEERRRFAQQTHEYLIEQLQYTGAESITSSSNKIQLNFNHPVKELIWVVQRDSFVDCTLGRTSSRRSTAASPSTTRMTSPRRV
jgi:hypothetical protein